MTNLSAAAAPPQLWETLSLCNPPCYTTNQNAGTPQILPGVPPLFNQLTRVIHQNN